VLFSHKKRIPKRKIESEGGSIFASKLASTQKYLSTHSKNQKGVADNFLNLPVTPPKQYQVATKETKPVENIITAYRNEIKRMVSPERFINQQYNEVHSRT
jgi:hypothetical protein